MALMVLFCFLSLSDLHGILAAPAFDKNPAIPVMSTSRGFGPSYMTSLSTVEDSSLSSFPEIFWVNPYATELQNIFPVVVPFTASPSKLEVQSTTTVTVVKEEPTTITLLPSTTTVTAYVTIPISSSAAPSPTAGHSVEGLGPAKAVWVAPTKMDDLTPFGIAGIPGGKENLQIVSEIPAEANAIPTDGSNAVASTKSDDSTSILQLLFPAGSISPSRKPQGGAEFYATPLDISSARNVTLRYSVFFPADFDWVLAGKLPGLYGGHKGCSGGNAALDCFSTRLMWREGGAGELYLYAPKDKQTDALCSDPQSVCDAAYGLSIGRGSFTWAAGDWTTVQQTVVLNTPGLQDGSFMLDVNGQKAINRVDVLYRDDLADKGSDGDDDDDSDDASPTSSPEKTATSTKRAKPASTSGSTKPDDGGLLGPILGGLLQGLGLRDLGRNGLADNLPVAADPRQTAAPTATTASPNTIRTRSSNNPQVEFTGIFFSTFFGGHEDKYATPRDQYIWFKDFALAYNA